MATATTTELIARFFDVSRAEAEQLVETIRADLLGRKNGLGHQPHKGSL